MCVQFPSSAADAIMMHNKRLWTQSQDERGNECTRPHTTQQNKRTFCLSVSVAVHMQCYGLSRLSRTRHNIDTTIHRHSHHFALQLTQLHRSQQQCDWCSQTCAHSYTLRNGINKARQNGLVLSDIQNWLFVHLDLTWHKFKRVVLFKQALSWRWCKTIN